MYLDFTFEGLTIFFFIEGVQKLGEADLIPVDLCLAEVALQLYEAAANDDRNLR